MQYEVGQTAAASGPPAEPPPESPRTSTSLSRGQGEREASPFLDPFGRS